MDAGASRPPRWVGITFVAVLVAGWAGLVAWYRVHSERACAAGDGEVCMQLGDAYATGRIKDGIWKDTKRAEQFYRKGCDASYAASCSALITHLGRADPQVMDAFGKAFMNNIYRNAEQECRRKETDSCVWLGTMHELSGEADAAAQLYKMGCDQGSQEGCKKLAALPPPAKSP